MTWWFYIFYILLAICLLLLIINYLNNMGFGIFSQIMIITGIVILEIIFYIIIYFNGKIVNINYPPTPNICPDYWEYNNKLCLIPNNKRNTGSWTISSKTPGYYNNSIDFSNPDWSLLATTDFCAKQKWANTNNILWDGITNVDSKC